MGGADDSGRLSSAEMLDVNTMTWEMVPPLPIPLIGNRGVHSEGGTYLGFSTGGYGTQDSSIKARSKIYGFKETSKNIYDWEEVHNMSTTRYYHSVVNVPKTLLPNC